MIVFEHVVPSVLIWLAVVGAMVVAAFSYWRFVQRDLLTIAIVVVRLLFFALLAWCLFVPGLKEVSTELLKPRFIVAADTTGSMLLSPTEELPDRWATATEALNMPWTDAVAAECEIDAYAFSTDIGSKLSLGQAAALTPNGTATLLRDSLKKIVGRHAGLNVAGCLLLSDGIDTREAYDDWASEPRPFPVYTVLLEPKTGWEVKPDVRVDTVNTPRRVTVGWKTELKAVLSGQGTRGEPITAQLYGDGALRQELPITIPVGGGSREVRFGLDHPEMGVFTYRVHVPALTGETHTNDNSYSVSVQVITSRNHLLYVEGPPRWESKYLTRALRANDQMTPLIFLRGPDGQFMTFGESGSMTPEMRESQLTFFKIVVLGNLDAEELGAERAQNLVTFTETGGSLILLGGSKAWGPDGFAQTPLRKLMPVKGHGTAAREGSFPVALTDAGRAHPALAGDPDLWDLIPPVLSIFPDATLSHGARALVVAGETSGKEHPLVVTHRYGQGKVAAIFTDSLWKWRLTPDGREHKAYSRFWNQLIAWLAPEEKELKGKELDIFADREQLFLGEEIELSARQTDQGEDSDDLAVQCRITGPDGRALPYTMEKRYVLTPSGKSLPGYAVSFRAEHPGLHTAVAVAKIDGKAVDSDPISFFVKPFTPESVPRPANIEVLRALADSSGGRYYESIDALNDALSSMTFAAIEEEMAEYRSLWQYWLVIALLTALLTAGWVLRKVRNMP